MKWLWFYNCDVPTGWSDILNEITRCNLNFKKIVYTLQNRFFSKHLQHILLCEKCYVYLRIALKFFDKKASLFSCEERSPIPFGLCTTYDDSSFENFEVIQLKVALFNFPDKMQYFNAPFYAVLCKEIAAYYTSCI